MNINTIQKISAMVTDFRSSSGGAEIPLVCNATRARSTSFGDAIAGKLQFAQVIAVAELGFSQRWQTHAYVRFKWSVRVNN